MTTHTPAIEISHDQPSLPNQHFSSWLRGQTTLFISQIVAILGSVSFLASMIYYVAHLDEQRKWLTPLTIQLIVDYAHIVFMAVFILFLIKVLDDNERGSYRVKLVYRRVFEPDEGTFKLDEAQFEETLGKSKKQLRKFKRRFLLFWIGMLVLYVAFACQHSYKRKSAASEETSGQHIAATISVIKMSPNGKQEIFKSEINYSPNGEAVAAHSNNEGKAVSFVGEPPELYPLNLVDVWKQLAFPLTVFFFNNFTLLCVFWCFLAMYTPAEEMGNRERAFLKYSFHLIVALVTLLFPVLVFIKGSGFNAEYWQAFSSVFHALSGVLNAIALTLLIARLDSKLVGLPSWLICVLYSYAAIQPLFFVFELEKPPALQKIVVFVLIFVFMSKIYFFLIIMYALQTGKMLNYLFCFPILRQRANDPNISETPFVHKSTATQTHSVPDSTKMTEGWVVRHLDYWDKRVYGRLRIKGQWRIKWVRERVSQWMRNDRPLWISKWLGLVALCSFFILLLIASRYLDSIKDAGGKWSAILKIAIDCLHLLALSGMIAALYLVRKKNDYDPEVTLRARHIFREALEPKYRPEQGMKQLEKFKVYFLFFWCATFVLYTVFLSHHIALLLPHLEITNFTPKVDTIGHLVKILFFPFLEFSLGSLNLLFIFWCFAVLHTPAFDHRAATRQQMMINYSSFVVILLIAVFLLLFFLMGGQKLKESEMQDYTTIFDAVLGMLSAIALALLIARMDSKLFGLPWWSIWILFAYASIQPLFVAFALKVAVLEVVKTLVLAAALGLKICFFLIVAYSLQSGRVLNYLVCFPFLRDRVDSIFDNQFEIKLDRDKANKFVVSILKKNKLYYSTPRRFMSRKSCDRFVRYLRKRMKNREAYFPPSEGKKAELPLCEEAGTYWVELRSKSKKIEKKKLICESIPLKSKDEAEELIRESIDKIPYCKYNRT